MAWRVQCRRGAWWGFVSAYVLIATEKINRVTVEPSVVAMLGGLLLLALSRLDATDVAKDVKWPTLVFFAGLLSWWVA